MPGSPHPQSIGDPIDGHRRLQPEQFRDPNFFKVSFGLFPQLLLRPLETRQFAGYDSLGLCFGGLVNLRTGVMCCVSRIQSAQQFRSKRFITEIPAVSQALEFLSQFLRPAPFRVLFEVQSNAAYGLQRGGLHWFDLDPVAWSAMGCQIISEAAPTKLAE